MEVCKEKPRTVKEVEEQWERRHKTPEIKSLADLAPTAEAPRRDYNEAVEWVAGEFGSIQFERYGVTVKLPRGTARHNTLEQAVQVLETLDRYEARGKELKHELAELEARSAKLREEDFLVTVTAA